VRETSTDAGKTWAVGFDSRYGHPASADARKKTGAIG
jgi:hypothetical protein